MSTKMGTAMFKGEDSYEAGAQAAKKAMEAAGISKPDIVITFVSSKYDYPSVVKGIREATGESPLIGCSSAGEFTEASVDKQSVACAVISSDTHKFFTGMGKGLGRYEVKCLEEGVVKLPTSIQFFPFLSSFLLIDGLAGKGEETVFAAFSAFGPTVKFSGGAAGDDLAFKETKVFTDDQIESDAVSLCLVASKIPIQIGVSHGHSPISPAFTITKAKGNILYEVDGQPAYEVWKKHTAENAAKIGIEVNKLSSPTEVGSFLIRYEAGLLTGTQYKVRVPLSKNADGSLNFACTMLEGSVIRIMEGLHEAQIASARKAAQIALTASRGVKLAGAIVFDCCCRGIILQESFKNAVNEIKGVLGNIPLIGFETYGEIAMELGQMSGFHNTSTVIALIPA